MLACQANSWMFKLPDPALVWDATNRAVYRSFIHWAVTHLPW